jgi:hypothetical protein
MLRACIEYEIVKDVDLFHQKPNSQGSSIMVYAIFAPSLRFSFPISLASLSLLGNLLSSA